MLSVCLECVVCMVCVVYWYAGVHVRCVCVLCTPLTAVLGGWISPVSVMTEWRGDSWRDEGGRRGTEGEWQDNSHIHTYDTNTAQQHSCEMVEAATAHTCVHHAAMLHSYYVLFLAACSLCFEPSVELRPSFFSFFLPAKVMLMQTCACDLASCHVWMDQIIARLRAARVS